MNATARNAIKLAQDSAAKARAAERQFLTCESADEAEHINELAKPERMAAFEAAADCLRTHETLALALADGEEEDSGWYEAHLEWKAAVEAWDCLPDLWEEAA